MISCLVKSSEASFAGPVFEIANCSSPHQRLRKVGPAVPEKLPCFANLADHVEIEVSGQHFIPVSRRLGDDLAAWIAEVIRAIELAAIPRCLDTDSIDRPHK